MTAGENSTVKRRFGFLIQQKSRRLLALSIYAFLVASTIVAYEPLRHNDFVSYDDYSYITQNPHVTGGLTLKSIKWAFTESHFHMWHPLTSVSHMLDCELFGLDPFWHHLVSLLLHMASSCLLFQILQKMTGRPWQSAFVAAVFALHPLNVESVAWAAERKSALSCVLWMLTILVYVRYVERPRITRYLPVVLSFCLAGMAKPMVVTLPFVLLLLDYWPLERFQSASQRKNETPKQRGLLRTHWLKSRFAFLIKEKIPLFILSVGLSVVTFVVQRGGKVVATTEMLPVGWRVANAVVSYVRYMTKMAYPYRLAPLYPHPAASPAFMAGRCLPSHAACHIRCRAGGEAAKTLFGCGLVVVRWYVGAGYRSGPSRFPSDCRSIYLPTDGGDSDHCSLGGGRPCRTLVGRKTLPYSVKRSASHSTAAGYANSGEILEQ